ncbi:hypothetical protein V5799_006183 [Amblyomma americanum]|uniref:Uncharacterized protein n=1 Tax=Amblyomma americanum TaxID=6943 RepID=A0AAQ4DX47_AMBAM
MQRCFAFVERRLLTCGATYFVTRAASGGQTEARILKKLKEALTPQELLVENESHMHNVPKGSETHFRVTVVSSAFEGKNMVQRRLLCAGCLSPEQEMACHILRTLKTLQVSLSRASGSGHGRPCNTPWCTPP